MFHPVHCKYSALTTASLVNSFQCTGSHSKRLKNEGNEEVSPAVDGAKALTPDPDPEVLNVNGKPEKGVKMDNTEVSSEEEEASPSRKQLDQNSSDNIKLPGEKLTDYVLHVS